MKARKIKYLIQFKKNFLITLLTQVLKLNVFEFGLRLFAQKIGTAMGTRLAPVFANLFMAMIDNLTLAIDEFRRFIAFYKRFIDDIFIIWTGTEEDFIKFMTKINTLHKTNSPVAMTSLTDQPPSSIQRSQLPTMI